MLDDFRGRLANFPPPLQEAVSDALNTVEEVSKTLDEKDLWDKLDKHTLGPLEGVPLMLMGILYNDAIFKVIGSGGHYVKESIDEFVDGSAKTLRHDIKTMEDRLKVFLDSKSGFPV